MTTEVSILTEQLPKGPMKEPLVSVKMATYNHAPYISRAIEGVLMQKTNFPFELVIGEDCSTDRTREIVFDYQQKYPDIIRVITSEKNVGMQKNSMRIDQACNGKYIAYCEGDDYWHRDDKMQKQVDILETDPECCLVCSDYDALNVTTGKRIKSLVNHRGWKVPSSRDIEDYLAQHGGNEGSMIGGSIMTLTVMGRSQLIKQIKTADPHLHQSGFFKRGDTQLWAEMNSKGKIVFIPESLATHSVLPESASKSKNKAQRLLFLINGSELFLYLCDKYIVSQKIRGIHERAREQMLLPLAFYQRNSTLAEMVKDKKGLGNMKEKLLYLGTKNSTVHFCYTTASQIIKLFKKHENWI